MSTNPDEDRAFLSQDDTALLSRAEILQWEDGKTFSTDWAGHHFFNWAELLYPFRQKPVRLLEIGSWEGRSALFFLNYLPLSRIVCIDPFTGSAEHHQDPYFADLARNSERRFDTNLAAFEGRLEKIKGSSAETLPRFGIAGRRFDLAYIDGSHMAADVYRDAVLTWSLMAPGGIVLFDDYEWNLMENELERPKLGIDEFMAAHEGQYRLLHRAYQIAIEKL
ncbi:class I SAM-dependent methyltransferase [Bradyrhizobium sp. LHD-71]|uniref:class I SAM-dependent methyltransferase n=1 Tax=Bradyrhizobium sp. LHD-71 TaxID=3072141 RepID=UPI00280FCBF0|nr:class I SAM-dependent methyltransferase [Bradyrhizobium sp. LHD-71]MDQ8731497.1 class I SAM-dependent methyltransferase [Bradyrhizobium sp. LHD-71]